MKRISERGFLLEDLDVQGTALLASKAKVVCHAGRAAEYIQTIFKRYLTRSSLIIAILRMRKEDAEVWQ